MKKLGRILMALLLLGITAAFAQEAEVREPEMYEPLGGVGYEYGEYQPIEGYEAGVTDAEIGGTLVVRTASPDEQGIDVVLVGPDGFIETAEVAEEQVFEGLPPGTYSISATDDGLQAVIGQVDIVLGQLATVTADMQPADFVYGEEAYTAYEPYGEYEVGEYEAVEGLEEVGTLVIEAGEEVEGLQISLVGPNDYREEVELNEVVEGLQPGAYAIAATAPGYQMAQGVVAVRVGEQASTSFTLQPYERVVVQPEAVAVEEEEAVVEEEAVEQEAVVAEEEAVVAEEEAVEEEAVVAEQEVEEETAEVEQETDVAGDSISAIVLETPEFSTLAQALEATNLVEYFSEVGPFTVFAPTNEAFAALPEGDLDALLNDPARLQEILLYHVTSGEIYSADLAAGELAMQNEGTLEVVSEDGTRFLIGDAGIVTADIDASNGVIHAIDTVLLPNQ